MKWFILVGGILCNAFASVLVKIALEPPRRPPSLWEPFGWISNWPFWTGLALYGIAFLLYAFSLTKFPLNVAHPILTSGAVAMVAVLSIVLFNEAFSWITAVGLLLVVIGVILISSRVV